MAERSRSSGDAAGRGGSGAFFFRGVLPRGAFFAGAGAGAGGQSRQAGGGPGAARHLRCATCVEINRWFGGS